MSIITKKPNGDIWIDKFYFRFDIKIDGSYWVHHLYYGIVSLLVWILDLNFVKLLPEWASVALFIIGLILTLDDLYQHYRQGLTPNYVSPIHKLYQLSGIERLRPIVSKWLKKININIDNI